MCNCPDYLNDLYIFNPAANSWTQLSPTGALPSGRRSMGFTVTPDGQLWVLGGLNSSHAQNSDAGACESPCMLFFRIICVRAWPNERESVQSSCGDEYWHFQFSFLAAQDDWVNLNSHPTARVRYIRIASYSLEERCSKTQSSMEIVLRTFHNSLSCIHVFV